MVRLVTNGHPASLLSMRSWGALFKAPVARVASVVRLSAGGFLEIVGLSASCGQLCSGVVGMVHFRRGLLRRCQLGGGDWSEDGL
jgi:hypothetical protein